MGSLGAAVLSLLALAGTPLAIVILAAAILGFWVSDVPMTVIAIEMYRIVETPLLLALPLFTFSGYVLAESGMSHRMVALTSATLGWLPGGLALVAFVTCAFFTAFTGASGVTIVAIGALLYPALQQGGYTERFSLGLVTTSGSLGLLLAPSLPLILYGVLVQQMDLSVQFTIQDLFLAGLMPAGLMVALLSAYTVLTQPSAGAVPKGDRPSVRSALWAMRFELPLPVVLLGGIYSGFFAVSEAAAITAIYVLIVEVGLYREISLSALVRITREAMMMVGGILLILAVSLAFTNFLVDAEIPQWLFEHIRSWVSNPLTFLLLLNLILLVLGAILDIFSALIIMIPLIVPVAMQFGIHPVHLGIVFLANMQIGYFTPPVGMNLFIASYRFKKPISELYAATLPFMGVLMIALALITYVPWLSLAWIDP
jgi:C4-dicarboxylate transporter DctM subunit